MSWKWCRCSVGSRYEVFISFIPENLALKNSNLTNIQSTWLQGRYLSDYRFCLRVMLAKRSLNGRRTLTPEGFNERRCVSPVAAACPIAIALTVQLLVATRSRWPTTRPSPPPTTGSPSRWPGWSNPRALWSCCSRRRNSGWWTVGLMQECWLLTKIPEW